MEDVAALDWPRGFAEFTTITDTLYYALGRVHFRAASSVIGLLLSRHEDAPATIITATRLAAVNEGPVIIYPELAGLGVQVGSLSTHLCALRHRAVLCPSCQLTSHAVAF